MHLESSKGKVFTLLAACLPENKAIKKDLLLDEIELTSEYANVKALPCWKYLSQFYSENALRKYDIVTLKNVKSVLAKIPKVFSDLESAVTHGNGWELTEKDIPDWTSPESIDAFDAKLKSSPDTFNLTNLVPSNIFTIFSKDVIKNPAPILEDWHVEDCDNIAVGVSYLLEGKHYCLPRKPFDEQAALISKADDIVCEVSKHKSRLKRSTKVKKGSTIVAGLLVALLAPAVTNMAIEGMLAFYCIAIVFSIIYAIKG